jgi:hypothetical protein
LVAASVEKSNAFKKREIDHKFIRKDGQEVTTNDDSRLKSRERFLGNESTGCLLLEPEKVT